VLWGFLLLSGLSYLLVEAEDARPLSESRARRRLAFRYANIDGVFLGPCGRFVHHCHGTARLSDRRGKRRSCMTTAHSAHTTPRVVNLSPGMAVTVEIKTGSRRILSYLLSPLLRCAIGRRLCASGEAPLPS